MTPAQMKNEVRVLHLSNIIAVLCMCFSIFPGIEPAKDAIRTVSHVFLGMLIAQIVIFTIHDRHLRFSKESSGMYRQYCIFTIGMMTLLTFTALIWMQLQRFWLAYLIVFCGVTAVWAYKYVKDLRKLEFVPRTD